MVISYGVHRDTCLFEIIDGSCLSFLARNSKLHVFTRNGSSMKKTNLHANGGKISYFNLGDFAAKLKGGPQEVNNLNSNSHTVQEGSPNPRRCSRGSLSRGSAGGAEGGLTEVNPPPLAL